MFDHCSPEEPRFPKKNLFTRAQTAVFLPVVVLFCLFACGGGSKNIDTVTVSDASQVPEIDEPVVSEFILGIGDELAIRVWGQEDLNRKVRLDVSGEFYYPFVGYINAAGMSIKDLRQTVNEGLLRYYVNPQVGIEVLSMRSLKTFVLGEVKSPGVYVLDGTESAVEVISKAGGFTDDSNKSSVILIRGDFEDPYLQRLNIQDFLVKGDVRENVLLEPGDVIYVPSSFIADIRTFFKTAHTVLRPVVELERAVILAPRAENVLLGDGNN